MDRSFANVRRTSKVGRGRKGTPSETPGEGVLAGGKHDNELQMQEQAARNAFDKVGAPERTTSCDVVSIRKKKTDVLVDTMSVNVMTVKILMFMRERSLYLRTKCP